MDEFLCKEIVADVVGAYLMIYQNSQSFRREYEIMRLAKELTDALTIRGRVVLPIFSSRSANPTSRRQKIIRSILSVNNQCLVIMVKTPHLDTSEFNELEKQISISSYVVGLTLNFGSRFPEFWHFQMRKSPNAYTK